MNRKEVKKIYFVEYPDMEYSGYFPTFEMEDGTIKRPIYMGYGDHKYVVFLTQEEIDKKVDQQKM